MEIGTVVLNGCDNYKQVDKLCENFLDIIIDLGLDRDTLLDLIHGVVKDCTGISHEVIITAIMSILLNRARKKF